MESSALRPASIAAMRNTQLPGAAFGKKLILHFLVKARGNLLRRAHLRDDRIDALSFFQPGVDIGADVPVDARFCFQRQAQLPLDGIDIALDSFSPVPS